MAIQQIPSVLLSVENMTVFTGSPERKLFCIGARKIPAWSFEGQKSQAVVGTLHIPENFRRIKVVITVCAEGKVEKDAGEMVFRVSFVQGTRRETAFPVRSKFAAGNAACRTITLSVGYDPNPKLPLELRIERLPEDPADTFSEAVGLTEVCVTPAPVPSEPLTIQNAPGYNSWPMIQALGTKLVCAYSRGTAHTIDEGMRGVYARTSSDGGQTWSPEVLVVNNPEVGEVTAGKGLDEKGAMLLWVRAVGEKIFRHDLYRSADGVCFSHIAAPELDPVPMQITDVLSVPGVGLMSLWFSGNYKNDTLKSWGTLTSTDNGKSWKQHVVAEKIPKKLWPTEPSAIYLGNGRILAIARTEAYGDTTEFAQFQLESTDGGKNWSCCRTNIRDICISTPSLLYDPNTGLVSNYYFQRGRGLLKRRVAHADQIFKNPLSWPAPEIVSLGGLDVSEAGNVNATMIGNLHFPAYYTGQLPQTAVVVAPIPAPRKASGCADAADTETP